jgi:AraC family transcriptional regulator of adaptative response / DNA-3-methyladenine glycosylase II
MFAFARGNAHQDGAQSKAPLPRIAQKNISHREYAVHLLRVAGLRYVTGGSSSRSQTRKARPGLRVPGAWDGFELAVRAVLGQQITVSAAANLAGRLVAQHGKRLANPIGGLTHAFPRPKMLVNADLAPLGMPRSRAETLSAVASAAVANKHLFDATGGLDDAVRRLRAIRGIGEWTAQYIALRQLREPDAFPAADIALIRAMADREGYKRSASELLDRAESWRPWRAYAAQHLWASC